MAGKKHTTYWNFTPLFKTAKTAEIEKVRKDVKKASAGFIKKWKTRNDYLKKPFVLKKALDEYENWQAKFGAYTREDYYYGLKEAQDQTNTNIKANVNIVDKLSKELQNEMQFFEIRIAKINPKLQKKFLSYKPLAPYKHFLEKLFEVSKHLLSEPEEKIMTLKSTPAYSNWVRMTSSLIAKEERVVIDEDGKKKIKNFSELLAMTESKNKRTRDSAAKALNNIFKVHLDEAENELNSVLQNKQIDDGLRKYERPDKARHISDDIDSETVDTLVKTVSNNFNISKRYYELKTYLLGVKKLKYYERNVEYGKIDKFYNYKDGVEIIDKTFAALDTEFETIFQSFVKNGQIDVYPAKGKQNGAFCSHTLITLPTYILLNWTDKLNDVLTFAHELGHGINNELIRGKQNSLNFSTPTSTAEVASTFMEDFVLQNLLKEANDELRLALMMMKLNEDINTIFRQIAFYNFEWELHATFRKKGYLSSGEIGKLFKKHMQSYMGEYVEQSEGSQNWWTYVSHFRYFFYVYSYAGGLLISKAMQSSVKKDPKFVSKVKDFLSAGTSESPKNIFKNLDIDITDQKFWRKGIKEVENLLDETENLAKRMDRI
jgi:oligoendopeptidase F